MGNEALHDPLVSQGQLCVRCLINLQYCLGWVEIWFKVLDWNTAVVLVQGARQLRHG